MILKGMDEERRSVLWRIVIVLTSIIILCVFVFFGMRLFTKNPLEGVWESEDVAIMLEIDKDDSVVAIWEADDGSLKKINLTYTLDKEDKTVSIRPVQDESTELESSTGELAELGLEASFGLITATFDYSLEGDSLVLTEREYGEQLVFKRK